VTVDVYDIDLEELGVGELFMLQERIESEFKRRQFPGSGRRDMTVDKQLAALAADLRSASQRMRRICRDARQEARTRKEYSNGS
jgi:hypothetical protein